MNLPAVVGRLERGVRALVTERVGCCTLHLADYRDVLPTLQGVTAIVADPPHGNDYRQKRSRDKLVRPDMTHAPIVGNAEPFDPRPLLQAAPVVVLWGANYYADKLPANGKWLVWDKREATTPDDGADVELAWTNLRGVRFVGMEIDPLHFATTVDRLRKELLVDEAKKG